MVQERDPGRDLVFTNAIDRKFHDNVSFICFPFNLGFSVACACTFAFAFHVFIPLFQG
jgi:hypothetical protein